MLSLTELLLHNLPIFCCLLETNELIKCIYSSSNVFVFHKHWVVSLIALQLCVSLCFMPRCIIVSVLFFDLNSRSQLFWVDFRSLSWQLFCPDTFLFCSDGYYSSHQLSNVCVRKKKNKNKNENTTELIKFIHADHSHITISSWYLLLRTGELPSPGYTMLWRSICPFPGF